MGSQLTKNYDVEKQSFAAGGVNKCWRIHRAKKRQATNDALTEVCIFMFDKKNAKGKNNTPLQQQEIFDAIKRDA